MEWYVRSAGHTDAHYGLLDDDSPLRGEIPAATATVRRRTTVSTPPDRPAAMLPTSQTADTSEQETDGAAVAGLVDTLGRHSRWRPMTRAPEELCALARARLDGIHGCLDAPTDTPQA